jgi:hypothetical protein
MWCGAEIDVACRPDEADRFDDEELHGDRDDEEVVSDSKEDLDE